MTFYKNINPNYCLNDFSLTRRLNMNIMDQHVQTKHILIWTSERWVSSVTQEDLWKNITIKHKTFFCHTVTAVAPFLFYFIFIFSQQSFITILELLLLWKGKNFFFHNSFPPQWNNSKKKKEERTKICLRRKGWMNYASFFYEANVVLNVRDEWEKKISYW